MGNNSTTPSSIPVDVSGLTNVVAISAGEQHTCALTVPAGAASGGVKCWGANTSGQLGDGTMPTRHFTPVDVSGLTSNVAAISSGNFHTCALTISGGVQCWGNNGHGQLGDGSTATRSTPVSVSGLTNTATAIVAGIDQTCAQTDGSGMKCWGYNVDGRLGNNTTTESRTPVDVYGLGSGVVIGITTGFNHSCALTSIGQKCWGSNSYGQIGDGTNIQRLAPVSVVTGTLATYTYGDPNHKHAVTALSSGESYTYDANGNMIQRVEGGVTYTQTFDAENRLISVSGSGQTTQFIYDGDGNLVKKIKPDGSKTIYIGGVYEVDKNAGGTVTRTVTYYPVAGAMRISTNNTVYYTLKDHLGSASVVTDFSAIIVGTQRYYPYGETRLTTGTMYTDKLFTGQREMAGLGIYHYGARFFSPKLGRFLSADSIVPGAGNPQNLNHYSYVINNPIRYIDPSGRCWKDKGGHMVWFSDSDAACGSVVPLPKPNFPPPPTYGLIFKGKGGFGDKAAFKAAVAREAGRQYSVYCADPATCGFSTPAELYGATHGTTVITFSNSSSDEGQFCERNANIGQEGVICYSGSKGKMTPILAAHELGHWFNELVRRNGHDYEDPYHDMRAERRENDLFPLTDVDITPRHLWNSVRETGHDGEDFANMYSMWVFDDWTDTPGNRERRRFMEDNMYTWILRTLYP